MNSHKASKIISPETIMNNIIKEKQSSSFRMSQAEPKPKQSFSFSQMLKNKLNYKKNPILFTSLDSSPANRTLEPLIEDTDEIIPSIQLEKEEDDIKQRRKCIIGRTYQEYESKSAETNFDEFLNNSSSEPLFLELNQMPVSVDGFLDFNLLEKTFVNTMREESYDLAWRNIIPERSIWGKKQNYNKRMSFSTKPLENSLLDLPKNIQKNANLIFKYILQYCDDKKTKFSKPIQLKKLLKLLLDDQLRFYLQDEVYLQLFKQITGNPSYSSQIQAFKLLAIVSSVLPPSGNNLLSVLNFLFNKAENEDNFDIISCCKYCFVRISKIYENGGRRIIPLDLEIACIEQFKQFMIPIYLLTGEHILVPCESYTLIKDIKHIIGQRFKIKEFKLKSFGLFFIQKGDKDNTLNDQGFLDEKNYIMELLSKWEELKKITFEKSKHNLTMKIFLKIRIFNQNLEDNDDRNLLYIQSIYYFLNDKFNFSENDVISLASIKMAVDYGDFSQEKSSFLKINGNDYVPKSFLEKNDAKKWIDQILLNYLQLKTYSKAKAKNNFIEYLQKFEEFQGSEFLVKFLKYSIGKKEEKTDLFKENAQLLIRKDYLKVTINDKTEKFNLFKIENLVSDLKTILSFKYEDFIIKIDCEKRKEIEFLIKSYIILIKK